MKKLIFIVFIGTFSFLTLSSKETTAFESTYQPGNSGDILIENARILTGTGNEIFGGSINAVSPIPAPPYKYASAYKGE